MAKRNRETLKNYFRQGKRPSEQEFGDLIDSTLNTLDDGFSGSTQIGIGLAPLSDDGVVLSAYRSSEASSPIWEVAVDKSSGDLQIRRRRDDRSHPLVTLAYDDCSEEVTIDARVACRGLKTSFKSGSVVADGRWQELLGDVDQLQAGCWAFRVVAGCGEQTEKRYALSVLTVVHCFGSKPRIEALGSFSRSWRSALRFRWVGEKEGVNPRLQVKSRRKYAAGTLIRFEITSLWDNPTMDNIYSDGQTRQGE